MSARRNLLRRSLPMLEARDVDRVAIPVYAVWEVTLRCDLACTHCGSRAGAARPDELTTKQALDFVRQMEELGVREVTLIGGEAYLRPDWLDIIRAIRARGMAVTMVTGGRNFTRERAVSAADAGLLGVSVSLDGIGPTHDAQRGRGAFERGLAALEAARAAGLTTAINSQINQQSAGEIDALCDLLVERRVRNWQIAFTVAMGRAADNPENLLQPHDLDRVYPALARVAERCRASGIRLARGNNVGYFGPLEERFEHDRLDYSCGCGAARSVLGVESDGTIKGCPSLVTESWSGGNVKEHALRAIWERGAAMQRLREPRTKNLWGFCATCYYAEECGGGCTWTADALLGKPGNNPYCHHRVLELKKQGLRERIVRTEAPPGLPFDRGVFELVVEPWAD